MKLEIGEMVCPNCDGGNPDKINDLHIWWPSGKGKKICPKCLGSGKVDWIENITGKKRNFYIYAPYIPMSLIINKENALITQVTS